MPRREFVFEPGRYYHIYNKSENKERLFLEAENYLFFLRKLKKYRPENLSIIAYCLMPTHFHFCIRIDGSVQVSKFISRLLDSYVKAFNKKYGRAGRLFKERYKPKLVDSDAYLMHLCRYIHLNPVEANLVNKPDYWAFSNYSEFVGARNGKLFDKSFFKQYWKAAADYERFVLDYRQKYPDGFDSVIFDE